MNTTKIKSVLLSVLFVASGCFVQAQDDKSSDYDKKAKSKDAINTNKPSPEKAIEKIVGTWQITEVLKDDKSMSGTDTVNTADTFVFNRENRYISYSDSEQIDSGMFRLNENHSILYLESETGGVPAEWNVAFDGEQMTIVPRQQTNKTKPLKFLYIKKEENEQ